MKLANPYRPKNDFKQNTGPKRHSNYYGFVKNRVGTMLLSGIWGYRVLEACYAKIVFKRCLFENHEDRKWYPKTFLLKVRHWDPLKTVLGSGFEKT